jgi:S-formylglutathione hydrolase FrmB
MPIDGWRFVGGLAVAAAALFVASFLLPSRKWVVRWGARLLALVLAVATAAAGVNMHYDYFPTLGALLGRRAADQVSMSTFRHMEQAARRAIPIGHGRLAAGARGRPLPSRGVVLPFVMPATVSGFHARTGEVYVPPIWFRSPHPHLPVLELLHGSPGSPADWTRGGYADLTADAYARSHDGFAPVIVMPDVNGSWDGDTECVNGRRGNAETYLTVDVRHAVVQHFGVATSGHSWAIAGLSEGGECALQIALRHPDDFAAAGDFSGDDHPWVSGGPRKLFWGANSTQVIAAEHAYDPRVLLADWHGRAPALWFSAGRSDRTVVQLTRLLSLAHRAGLRATLEETSGGHTFREWRVALERAMPWMMQHLAWEPPDSAAPRRA